jgi:hypothetical protein
MFFLPDAVCSGCMTAGTMHAWGRLFETTKVLARVAQKMEDGRNPSQPKSSSSPQSRASRPPPIPASSHLLLLAPAPRLRQPPSRRRRRVLLPQPAPPGSARVMEVHAGGHHGLGSRFGWWRRWWRVEVRRERPEIGSRGADLRRRPEAPGTAETGQCRVDLLRRPPEATGSRGADPRSYFSRCLESSMARTSGRAATRLAASHRREELSSPLFQLLWYAKDPPPSSQFCPSMAWSSHSPLYISLSQLLGREEGVGVQEMGRWGGCWDSFTSMALYQKSPNPRLFLHVQAMNRLLL